MALSQLSPGVVTREIDNSTVTTSSNPAYAAIAGPFERGPVNEIREISTEEQLKKVFGKPNNSNYEYWFAAAQYILYGGTIKVVRTDSASLKNAVSNGTAVKISNLQDYESNFESGTNTWNWAAKTPGTYANGVRVYVTDAGPDQLLTLDAPASGDEWQFAAGAAITSSGSGAAGKVFRYTITLSVSDIVGNFAAGAAQVGGDDCTILAVDKARGLVEVQVASDYTGIIIANDTLSQSSTGASATVETVTRKIAVVLNKNSAEFVAGDDISDTNNNSVNISSVQREYLTREIIPGLKWSSVAVRPGTTPFVAGKNGFRDEVHVVVVDTAGTITGTPNTILEKFIGLSKASDAKTTNGEANYYATAIKNKSAYIYFGSHDTTNVFTVGATAAAGNWGQAAANVSFNLVQGASTTDYVNGSVYLNSVEGASSAYTLSSGVDNYSPSVEEYINSINLFADPEAEEIDYILGGPMGDTEAEALQKAAAILSVVESRKDCMTFFSPLRSLVIGVNDTDQITSNLINYFSKFPSSSYAVFDSGYKYIYDSYNDVYRYVPCTADIAGLCLATSRDADPWFSPAGFQRGVLRNAIKLAYSPNKAQRDLLYAERINPVVAFPGQGIILFGDKTALGYPSAFDRINVRALFLSVEKVIARASRALLFAQNDETSRSQFRNVVEPYLRNIQGRRGVTDFLIKCDESNNPPESVDRGEFYAEIYLKPTRTINYITLSFVATRTGVAFNEIAS